VAATLTRGGLAIVSGVENVEKSRLSAEFLSAQVLPGSMKTKSWCEKGRNLGQHRVDAQIDGCLMSWGYSLIFAKTALMLLILPDIG
jgi:hypothetical protein